MNPPSSFSVAELYYHLPSELIAQAPAAERAASRLLVLDRASGELHDRRFSDLPELLRPNDLLVLNNTRVIPARFELRRTTGGRIEGLFLREVETGAWEVMLKNAGRVRAGEALAFNTHPSIIPDSEFRNLKSEIRNRLGAGRYLLQLEPPAPAMDVLHLVGRPPLPPYIRRGHESADRDAADAERYQTVYAREPGAIAAPTAGLHFTPEMLAALSDRGIGRAELTLHVGAGTFAPVMVEDLRDHAMHEEWYELPGASADRINAGRARGGRIVAVGTTSVRVLESCAGLPEEPPADGASGSVRPGSGWTRMFCYPPYRFRAVDAMLTNFHLPRSTLLALVMAFAGVEPVRRAYRHAVAGKYRFFSYGDAMLIA